MGAYSRGAGRLIALVIFEKIVSVFHSTKIATVKEDNVSAAVRRF